MHWPGRKDPNKPIALAPVRAHDKRLRDFTESCQDVHKSADVRSPMLVMMIKTRLQSLHSLKLAGVFKR